MSLLSSFSCHCYWELAVVLIDLLTYAKMLYPQTNAKKLYAMVHHTEIEHFASAKGDTPRLKLTVAVLNPLS